MGVAGRALKVVRNLRWHAVGRCNGCGHATVFICLEPTTARGGMWCPRCRSFSRKRHVLKHLLEREGGLRSLRDLARRGLNEDVYSAGATDIMARFLGGDPRFHCSDYLEDVPRGEPLPGGGTCQDLEKLTFPDDSFDVVITEDVLEHVRYPERAFAEIARVLRPGGAHIFTVPLRLDRPTLERVEPREDGEDRLLTEPEYHGDPLRGNIIAYRTFGNDIFERLGRHGFETTLDLAMTPLRRLGIVDSTVLVSRLTG